MGDLYVWDPEEHYPGLQISSIEQAEEIATDYEGHPINEKIRNWLKDVRNVVLDPNLKANFTDFMINERFKDILDYYRGYPSNVFVEDDPLRSTPYLYKVMVDKLREHGLYGFDGGAYVFYSQDQVFPNGEEILAYLDGIEPITADEMLALKKLPQTKSQLSDFLRDQWLVAQKDLGFKSEVRPEIDDTAFKSLYRDLTPNLVEIVLFETNSNATIDKIFLKKFLKISDNHTITLSHHHTITGNTLNYLPEHAHLDKTKAYEYETPQDLHHVLQQIHDFLIYEQQYCESFEKLHEWVNYSDYKKYATGVDALRRLVFAKYMQDANYQTLLEDAVPFAQQNDYDFKNITAEGLNVYVENLYKRTVES